MSREGGILSKSECLIDFLYICTLNKTIIKLQLYSNMATYNIIGDIHGRTCWKELVQDDFVNIFVGDYLDP